MFEKNHCGCLVKRTSYHNIFKMSSYLVTHLFFPSSYPTLLEKKNPKINLLKMLALGVNFILRTTLRNFRLILSVIEALTVQEILYDAVRGFLYTVDSCNRFVIASLSTFTYQLDNTPLTVFIYCLTWLCTFSLFVSQTKRLIRFHCLKGR